MTAAGSRSAVERGQPQSGKLAGSYHAYMEQTVLWEVFRTQITYRYSFGSSIAGLPTEAFLGSGSPRLFSISLSPSSRTGMSSSLRDFSVASSGSTSCGGVSSTGVVTTGSSTTTTLG